MLFYPERCVWIKQSLILINVKLPVYFFTELKKKVRFVCFNIHIFKEMKD